MIFALDQTSEKGFREIHDEPAHRLMEEWYSTRMNKMLYYVKFAENVVEGQAVRTRFTVYAKSNISPMTAGGSDYPAAGSSDIIENDANYLSSLAGLNPQPTMHDYPIIAITSGAGEGQQGYIESYSNKKLLVKWYEEGGNLRTALGATTDYVIYAPWYVELADTAAQSGGGGVNGVAVTNANAGQYGWIINRGRGRVLLGADLTTAVSIGIQVKPGTGGAAGRAIPIAAADTFNAFATIEHLGATGNLVQASIHCSPLSIIDDVPEEFISAHPPAPSGGIM